MTQRELCNRWQVSETTLERWRSEGIGPIYVKLGGQVRYRQEDVLEYEASCLCVRQGEGSTSHSNIALMLHSVLLKFMDFIGR
ncbi:helix-turn-helix transcriptional regulator [Alkalimarinus coralli]|uniref:helix-turn-helix transcriptional regulator n=1 Tax=Alkalimarinus coralli TaxID=2935863 RepID=UPI00202AF6D5|nr:helix-turn-helix domain-containing protein [Alkalimarinus coralli]